MMPLHAEGVEVHRSYCFSIVLGGGCWTGAPRVGARCAR